MLEAIILGIIQGITELLPVSSSGHLAVLPKLLEKSGSGLDFSFQDTNFDIVLHIATFLAILICYRSVIKKVFSDWRSESTRKLLRRVVITIVPALVVGGILFVTGDDFAKTPAITATMLIIFGLLFIWIDIRAKGVDESSNHEINALEFNKLSLKSALIIGLFQTLALIRGTSRSGATLVGGIEQKLNRKQALDYAFIVSIPIFAILTLVEIGEVALKGREEAFSATPAQLVAGFVMAFLSSMIVIQVFRELIKKRWILLGFGVYRIILGVVVLLLLA